MDKKEFLKIIKQRRVVRKFDRNKGVPKDALDRMLEAAIWAPLSIYHPQEWKFIVLEGQKRDNAVEIITQDHTILKYIRFMYEQTSIGHGEKWKNMAEYFGHSLGDAPVLIVCLVRFDPHIHQFGHNLGAAWCASENLMLQAETEGLNTGIISMASPRIQHELIDLLEFNSDEWAVAYIINVGYGLKIPQPVEREKEGVIIFQN